MPLGPFYRMGPTDSGPSEGLPVSGPLPYYGLMAMTSQWTVDMVEAMPHVEGERYEIIEGELHVTTQPHYLHQAACANLVHELRGWSRSGGGGLVLVAPGVIFAPDEAVAPDVVWIQGDRLADVLGKDGKLHAAPDLVVEVLSPGKANQERDRERKAALYERRGLEEYWIVDWQAETVDLFRREGAHLRHAAALGSGDVLRSPRLPGLEVPVKRLFES